MSALDKAIIHSKNKGVDEFEIIAIKKNITTVRITDSEIAEIKQNFDKNYGVRLIHQKKNYITANNQYRKYYRCN